MKKFTGILLAVLLIFTAVSCSFFMEEKNNNTESFVSFSLSGKSSKDGEQYFISEYITYGESTVQYGTWTDMAWNIWYYTTNTEAVLFTTPSEVGKTIADDPTTHGGWIKYDKPFRVTKGVTVWAYCENTLTSATNKNVTDEMFKGIAHEKVEKTKTYITVVPELDEKIAFDQTTTGTVLIDTLTYIMSEDQATVTSGSDISKLKVVVSMGDTSCTDTKALVTDTNHPYGYTTFSNIKLEGVKVSEGATTPSSIKVEFYGYKEDGETEVLLDSYNVYELSDANTNKVVELYVLNGLTTELKGITVENKTIKLGIVYINTTETDMFPGKYDLPAKDAFGFIAGANDTTIKLNIYANGSIDFSSAPAIQYYTKDVGWEDYTWGDWSNSDCLHHGKEITLQKGEEVFFRVKDKIHEFSRGTEVIRKYKFNIKNGTADAVGNVMYLIDPTGEERTVPAYAFTNLFYGCTGLTKAPELPATTLSDWCYETMFGKCTSLTDAPVLPAENLVDSCYSSMFEGCSSLKSVTVGFTDWKNGADTQWWLKEVSPEGVIHAPTGLVKPDPSSYDYVPSGWTIEYTNN